MKFKTKRLERWAVFHNVLVGYAYQCEGIDNGQRVLTAHLHKIENGMAFCAKRDIWILGSKGSLHEHYFEQNKSKMNLNKIFEPILDKISDLRRSI